MNAILVLVVGLLICGAGLCYFAKEKHNQESRKIYGTAAIVGAVVAIVGIVMLL